MEFEYTYYSASGRSFDDCAFLGQRFDKEWGFKPDRGESWVLQNLNGETMAHMGIPGWFTGLWTSPKGWVYVSEADGIVHLQRDITNRGSDPESWEEFEVNAVLTGVWGLNDACVFAWGQIGDDAPLFRWNGKAWKQMKDPGPPIRAIHGLAEDLIYAVGRDGLVARWDGTKWKKFKTPTEEVLSAVFVENTDEIYAVGNGGTILAASSHGIDVLTEGPGPLYGVAKFKGELYLGASELGLWRRKGATKKFECIKPKIHAEILEARETLVISTPEAICGTDDGKSFFITAEGVLEALSKGKKPLWET